MATINFIKRVTLFERYNTRAKAVLKVKSIVSISGDELRMENRPDQHPFTLSLAVSKGTRVPEAA